MTSSNRSLTDFLMEQDFVKLKEEARRKKQEDHKRAMEDLRQREEEAKRKAMEKAITPEDVKQAEKRGYDRGFEDAKQDTQQKMLQEFQSHLKELDERLESHDEVARKYVAVLMENATEMTRVILDYILDDVGTRYPNEMLRKAVERGLKEVNKDAELVIFVNPASQIYMADIAKDVLKKRTYKMKDDVNLPVGGCRIEWENCGHDSALENIHKDMQALLDGFRQGIHPDKIELPELDDAAVTEKDTAAEVSLEVQADEPKEKDQIIDNEDNSSVDTVESSTTDESLQ